MTGALVNGIPVPVLERDRGALLVRQAPVGAIMSMRSASRLPPDGGRLGRSGRASAIPGLRSMRRRLMQWLTQTRVSQAAGRSICDSESHARQALSSGLLDGILGFACVIEDGERQGVETPDIRRHRCLESPFGRVVRPLSPYRLKRSRSSQRAEPSFKRTPRGIHQPPRIPPEDPRIRPLLATRCSDGSGRPLRRAPPGTARTTPARRRRAAPDGGR